LLVDSIESMMMHGLANLEHTVVRNMSKTIRVIIELNHGWKDVCILLVLLTYDYIQVLQNRIQCAFLYSSRDSVSTRTASVL